MIRQHDRDFDDLVQRLDLDDSEIQQAQARLLDADPAPVSKAWIEATVARATVRVPVPWTRRVARLPLAAGLLAGVLLFGAAMTFTLLWPEGRFSTWTMTYPQAIEIVQRSEQPEGDRMVAAGFAFQRIAFGIRVLQETSRDPETPPLLAAAADSTLRDLRQKLLDPDPPAPGPVDDSMLASAEIVQDRLRSANDRLLHLQRVADLMTSGALALRRMHGLSAERERDRQLLLHRLMGLVDGD